MKQHEEGRSSRARCLMWGGIVQQKKTPRYVYRSAAGFKVTKSLVPPKHCRDILCYDV